MQIEAKNKQQVFLRRLNSNDLDNLFDYLQKLSTETKKRFGPHKFDRQSILDFYDLKTNIGYIALTIVYTNWFCHFYPSIVFIFTFFNAINVFAINICIWGTIKCCLLKKQMTIYIFCMTLISSSIALIETNIMEFAKRNFINLP